MDADGLQEFNSSRLTVPQWVERIDRLRADDELLQRGDWHGILNDFGTALQGKYVLARWAKPTVMVAHDLPMDALRFAQLVERALKREAEVSGAHGEQTG